MVRGLTIVLLTSIVTFICYKQTASSSDTMAAKSIASALHSVVYVTVPNITVAKQIAREVVTGKLAACVNIIPSVTSVYEWEGKLEEESELLLIMKTRSGYLLILAGFRYEWEGKLEEESELLLIMKTRSSALDKLKTKVIELHPYDVPEFIASPITSGNDAYLKWIDEQVVE
ncbi:Protein CutA -like protein [Toxocara canis]|uniref:Protein CutA-like protein n=1 Tax=Toxocara canis TaxID=6265 RepID=A0A0B2V141_TOXCA|nr:Protein CutA -like protein [Toxocara canis]